MLGELYTLLGVRVAAITSDTQAIRIYDREVRVAIRGVVLELGIATVAVAGSKPWVELQPGVVAKVPWSPLPLVWCLAVAPAQEDAKVETVEILEIAEPQLLVIGGSQGPVENKASGPCTSYSLRSRKSRCLAEIPTAHFYHSTALLDGHVYIAGGYNKNGTPTPAVERYDVKANTWTKLAPLPRPLTCLGLAAANGSLYAVGGAEQDSLALAEMQRYEIGTDTWTSLAPMATSRYGHGVAEVRGRLYVFGGRSGFNLLRSVECYDVPSDAWLQMAPMHRARMDFGVAVLGQYVYIIGGRALRSVERYDVLSNSWVELAPMVSQREHLSVAVDGEYIYVVGRGKEKHASIERYDPFSNTWQKLTDMVGAHPWGYTCVVVKQS